MGADRPAGAEIVLRAAEIEPLPPAHEEDDLDDVGRPDLPLGEREEPSWFASFRSAPAVPPEERRESFEAEAESAPEAPALGLETHDEPEESHSPWIEPEPERELPPPPSSPAPGSPRPPVQYGRRGGRSRR